MEPMVLPKQHSSFNSLGKQALVFAVALQVQLWSCQWGHPLLAQVVGRFVDSAKEVGATYGNAIAVSPDGALIAGLIDNQIVFWESANQKVRARSVDTFRPHHLQFATDSRSVYAVEQVSGYPCRVGLDGQVEADIVVGGDPILSPDGKTIALVDRGRGVVTFISASNLNQMHGQKRIGNLIDMPDKCVAFSPDGRHLVTCSRESRNTTSPNLQIWDVASGSAVADGGKRIAEPSAPVFLPDGKSIIIHATPRGLAQGTYMLNWNGRTIEVGRKLDVRGRPDVMKTSLDGKTLLHLTGRVLSLCDIESGKVRLEQKLGTFHSDFGLLPNGDIAIASNEGINVWRLDNTLPKSEPKFIVTPPLDRSRLVTKCAMSTNGQLLAFVDSRLTRLYLCNLEKRKLEVITLPKTGRNDPVFSNVAPALSPDGKWIAVFGMTNPEDYRTKGLHVFDALQQRWVLSRNAADFSVPGSDTPPVFSGDGLRLFVPANLTDKHELSKQFVGVSNGPALIAFDTANWSVRSIIKNDRVSPAVDARHPGTLCIGNHVYDIDKNQWNFVPELGSHCIAMSRDGKWILGANESEVTVWDRHADAFTKPFTAHRAAIATWPIKSVAFSSRDNCVVTTTSDRRVYLWSFPSISRDAQLLATFQNNSEPVFAGFRDNDRQIVVLDIQGTVSFWKNPTR